MPNFLAHSLTGFITGALLGSFLQYDLIQIVILGFISFIFSAIPDIDHPNSKTRKTYRKILSVILPIFSFFIFYIHLKINFLFSLLFSIIFSPVLIFLSELLIPKHRTLTHTFYFCFFVSFLFTLFLFMNNINNYLIYGLCSLLGISSHIILDKLF